MKKSLLALYVIATLSAQAHEHHSHDDDHTHATKDTITDNAHTHTEEAHTKKVHAEAPTESHTADNVADDHAHEHVDIDNKVTHEHEHEHEHKHDDDHVGHIGAHVHGEAQLNIAIDQSTIGIALSSPAMNIIGFEYEPKSTEDIKTAKDALDKISHSELFAMNTGDCKLATTDTNWQYKSAVLNEKSEAHAHEHDKAHDHKETHSDITVDLGYLCQDIAALKQIDVQLFAQFPHFEKINVLWVSADKQGSAVLTKDQTVIDLDK